MPPNKQKQVKTGGASYHRPAGGAGRTMYGQTDFEDYEEYEERMGTQFGFGEGGGFNPVDLNQMTQFETFEAGGCLKPREGIERFRKFRTPTQDFRLRQQKGHWWGGGNTTEDEQSQGGGTMGSINSGASQKPRTSLQSLAKKVRLGVLLRGKTAPSSSSTSTVDGAT